MFTSTPTEVVRLTARDPVYNTFLILAARRRGNSKTTGKRDVPMIDTTVFSADQVIFNDFKNDAGNCGDCPRSYNAKQRGLTCYTHGGHERIALSRMLEMTHYANEGGAGPKIRRRR